LIESIRDYAIFMLDTEGRVATWNRGAEAINQYCAEEVVGHSIDTFFTREDRTAGKPQRLLSVAIRDGRVEDEGWRVRKDGNVSGPKPPSLRSTTTAERWSASPRSRAI
jgi:PAS domain S-box-containing protein